MFAHFFNENMMERIIYVYMCHTGIYEQGSHPCSYPEWNMKYSDW